MSAISREEQTKINRVLKENNLIAKINTVLLENGLGDYTVDHIDLKHHAAQFPQDCPEGYEVQWICHNGTRCELKCMPKG
jgi:hypothetical protein